MNEFNPYEPPGAVVADPLDAGNLELADRGTRLGARLLDGVILGGGLGLLAALSIPAALRARYTGSGSFALGVAIVLVGGYGATLLILNLAWLHLHGQTVAKRILGIRILRANGDKASLGRILGLRIIPPILINFIPFIGPLLSLVNVLFIFREDRRCLHDLVADTIVVKWVG